MQPPQNITTPNSLVKYASAVLVSTSGKRNNLDKNKDKAQNSISNAQTGEILNSILPPREYTMEKQQLWIQSVSATPATRADVLELQSNLDNRLQTRQSRETGICPIREELYAQCFDELIRQITINCTERGLLLVRVRDEIKHTIQTYQTLYESSIAYGMRKALDAEQNKSEMEAKKKQLEAECSELTKQVDSLETKIQEIETSDKDQREADEKQHRENVDMLKKTNLRFKEELGKLLAGPQPQQKK